MGAYGSYWMTNIDIEYCVPCGLLPHALEAERALLDEFGRDIERLILHPSQGGVFKITVGDDVIWDKNVHGSELDLELIADAVRERALVAE